MVPWMSFSALASQATAGDIVCWHSLGGLCDRNEVLLHDCPFRLASRQLEMGVSRAVRLLPLAVEKSVAFNFGKAGPSPPTNLVCFPFSC